MRSILKHFILPVASIIASCSEPHSKDMIRINLRDSRAEVEAVLKKHGLAYSFVLKDSMILAITPKKGGPLSFQQIQYRIQFSPEYKVTQVVEKTVHTGP